jgi:glutathione peroxidase
MAALYEFSAQLNNGEIQSLGQYQGKVLLFVNTASKCGFTHQYEGLEKLQRTFVNQGFSVLAFPCNQFGKQEPGDDAEIQQFCTLTYQIDFPLFKKIDVNGDHAHPIFTYLKSQAPGILGSKSIKWNFTKFLVDKAGKVVKRYSPATTPQTIASDIQALLQ